MKIEWPLLWSAICDCGRGAWALAWRGGLILLAGSALVAMVGGPAMLTEHFNDSGSLSDREANAIGTAAYAIEFLLFIFVMCVCLSYRDKKELQNFHASLKENA